MGVAVRGGGGRGSGGGGAYLLLMASLVGTGVLALPRAAAALGALPAGLLLAACALASAVSGRLLSSLAARVAPRAGSYGELAGAALAPSWAGAVVSAVVYSYIAASACAMHLTSTLALQAAFSGGQLGQQCGWEFSLAVAAAALPLAQVRDLGKLSGLGAVGLGTILAAVGVVLARLVARSGAAGGLAPEVAPELVNRDSGFLERAAGALDIIFAFCGQSIFLEVLATMEDPAGMPRAVDASALSMLSFYSLVGGLGYALLGRTAPAPVTNALPSGPWSAVSNLALFVHVMCAYVINLNVLTQGAVKLCAAVGLGGRRSRASPPGSSRERRPLSPRRPSPPREPSVRGGLLWPAVSAALIAGCFLFSNLVSLFEDVVGLAASTGGVATFLFFPALFSLANRRRMGLGPAAAAALAALLLGAFVVGGVGLASTAAAIRAHWHAVAPPFACLPCAERRARGLTPGAC